MNNATDYMVVGGNAQFWTYSYSYSYNVLEAGTLELKKNFLQKGPTDYYYGSYSFYASGTHRTLLSGTGTQTLTFEMPSHSRFNILEVTNPNPLTLGSGIQTAQILKPSGALIINCSATFGVSGTLETDIVFNGDFVLSAYMNLNGRTMSVTGSVIHQSGQISFSGGRLEITGDYLQGRDLDNNGSYESYCYGSVTMNNASDYLLVGGNARFHDYSYIYSSYSTFYAGTVEVRGDFSQIYDSNGCYSYQSSGTHRTLLSGTGTQTVSFGSPDRSRFNILEVTNPGGVVFASDVSYTSLSASGVTLQVGAAGSVRGALASDAIFSGNVRISGSVDMQGHNLSITGSVDQIASVSLNGGILSVSGSYIHQSGELNLGGGRFEIGGDFLQQRDADGDGTFENLCNGRLTMNNATDYMVVGGNAQFWTYSYSYSYNVLEAGTLELKKNFLQKGPTDYYYGSYSYYASGTHRTLLSGTGTQTLTFEMPSHSRFNILEVTNPSGVVFATNVQFASLVAPAATIAVANTGGIYGAIDADARFSGTVRINGDVDLKGHTVSVAGGIIHQSGQISFSGGRLEVAGDFLQQRDADGDGTFESTCYGKVSMGSGTDYLFIGGNARFWSSYRYSSYYNSLSAGTIEIKGNFLQSGTGAPYFAASGTHRVLLSGTGTQTVTFDAPENNSFNILEVANTSGLSDNSTLAFTNSGKLKLNYQGTDVVGALYFSGTQQTNGLYDATNTGGLITGTGKIQVGPFANFTAWTAANTPGQTAAQDHDHDGVPNGVEYFMGKSGNDFTSNPGIAADGTVIWPKSPAFSGAYAVQTSDNLKDWSDVTNDSAQVTKNTNSIVWTRPTGAGKRFVRLVVTPN